MQNYIKSNHHRKKTKNNNIIFALFIASSCIIISAWYFKMDNQDNHLIIRSSSSTSQNFSGNYDGGISTMALKTVENFYNWTDSLWKNITSPQNKSISGLDYNLNRIDIKSYNFFGDTGGNFDIANDTSKKTDVAAGFYFSQEFTTPSIGSLIAIEIANLYIEHNLTEEWPGLYPTYYVVELYNESFEEFLGLDLIPILDPVKDGWVSFNMSSNILEPNKTYNLQYWILEYKNSKFYSLGVDSWKAENKTNTGKPNIGLSQIDIDDNGLVPIANDSERDYLLNFTYKSIINPENIDLKYIIDGQEFTPIYQKSIASGTLGYEARLIHNFESPPNQDVNITITANQIVESLEISIKQHYVYILNASGTYEITGSTIEWTIDYPYYGIDAVGRDLYFLYESDWEMKNFYNSLDAKMLELYSGPMKLYNESFEGLFDLWDTPIQDGYCRGIFQSPNYCSSINTQLKSGEEFIDKGYFQLGTTVKLEAEIQDSFGNPISGGSGNITMRNPLGEKVYFGSNLTCNAGILKSSEILLNEDFKAGFYDISIFWSNGQEVAFYTMQIEVRSPEEYFPPDYLLLAIILIGVGMASMGASLVARRYIKQRNWEKTLQDLFVLSKDGLSIYDHPFGIDVRRPELMSGMISALTSFMKEATGSKQGLHSIDQKDKKIILGHGEHVTVALLCEKDLPIIHKRVKKFTDTFEKWFGKYFAKWTGEVTMFKKADMITSKYFPISVEDKLIRDVREKLAEFRNELVSIYDKAEIIFKMQEITDFASRFQEMINKHSLNDFNEVLKIVDEKMKQ